MSLFVIIASGVVFLIGFTVLSLPALLLWKISKSVAHRFVKDDDTMRVSVPVFIGIMAIVFIIFLTINVTTHSQRLPTETPSICEWGMIYCVFASAMALLNGVFKAIGSLIARIREALENAYWRRRGY